VKNSLFAHGLRASETEGFAVVLGERLFCNAR